MGYRLTRKAIADLESIYLDSAGRFGRSQADKYAAELRGAIDILGRFPAAARLRREVSPPVYIYPTGSHVIVYQIDNGTAVIMRIRHARENWTGDPR